MSLKGKTVMITGAGGDIGGLAISYFAKEGCNIVALDINKEKATGEAMDLNHGLPFSNSNMKIYSADYDTCHDADIVVICAGVAQKPGETRPDLLARNTAVFKSIVDPVVASGFSGIFLVATN